MPSRAFRSRITPLILLGIGLIVPAAGAAEVDINGVWKLIVVEKLLETDLVLFNLRDHGGKVEGKITDLTQPFPPPREISQAGSKDGVVSVTFKLAGRDLTFTGKPLGDGVVAGVMSINGRTFPARIEKTKAEKLSPPPTQLPPIVQSYLKAKDERSAVDRTVLYKRIIAEKPGSPTMAIVYMGLLKDAEASGLSETEVRKLVKEWLDGTKPYGEQTYGEAATKALQALSNNKKLSALSLELAQGAETALGDSAPLAIRSEMAHALVTAAKQAGKDDLAVSARAKAEKLDGELDQEYHKQVPPFTPEKTAGPKDRRSDRVVVLELFTGAECPPCVGPDVAFEALDTSYRPTQLVSLQYHLHIPGPDPLTNGDSITRGEYYPDLTGTPSLYLDGKKLESSGGFMDSAHSKYDEYRKLIDSALEKPSGASVAVKVDRDGDSIQITASAESSAERQAKDAARLGGSKLRLRLALVEHEIRYVGGNGIRFHHNVVRGLPGGVLGKALTGGKGKAQITLSLAGLRKAQEQYLGDFAKSEGTFPRALPPIDLTKLAVVAFVQDDTDKSVLNAAFAEVPAGK